MNRAGKACSADTLAGFFELFADKLECVVLNACYSEIQAEVIAKHIPYVIGMKKAIGDTAAIEFSVAFYDALGQESRSNLHTNLLATLSGGQVCRNTQSLC